MTSTPIEQSFLTGNFYLIIISVGIAFASALTVIIIQLAKSAREKGKLEQKVDNLTENNKTLKDELKEHKKEDDAKKETLENKVTKVETDVVEIKTDIKYILQLITNKKGE